jgi:hypothetical protein
VILLLLLACDRPAWTVEGALAPGYARFDTDGDGAVSQAEYERLAFAMPPFAKVDGDGDGAIAPAEMTAWIGETDPRDVAHTLEGREKQKMPELDDRRAAAGWLVAEALRQEVLAVNPAAPVPTDAEMAAIHDVAATDDPAVRALLARIEAASAAEGLAFPGALRSGTLADDGKESPPTR